MPCCAYLQAGASCAAAPPPPPLQPHGRRLRHPGLQWEAQVAAPQPETQQEQPAGASSDSQGQQRLVSALLRELDASRQAGAATAAELAAVEGELLSVLRRKQERRRSSSAEDNSGVAPRKVAASYRPAAPVPAQHGIPAFRPGGRAPPSKPRLSPKRTPQQAQPPLVPELAALQQDNQELRGHLEAVYAHCRQLQQEQRQLQQEQRQLQRHVKASGSGAAAPAAHAEPPHGHMASPRRHLASPPTHHYATSATCTAAAAAEKQRQRQRSPGRTTLVVAPPRAGGADLALAVFEVRGAGVQHCSLKIWNWRWSEGWHERRSSPMPLLHARGASCPRCAACCPPRLSSPARRRCRRRPRTAASCGWR